MAKEVTLAELDQALAKLAAAKKTKNHERRQAAADEVAELRSAWRSQEEAAGRRTGLVATQDGEGR